MSQWVKLAELDDIPEHQLWTVECDGKPWVVIRSGREIRCFYDRCSHQNVRLSDFAQLDGRGGIVCFAHGARFCEQTGEPLCFPGKTPLWRAQTKWEGDSVWLDTQTVVPEN